MVLCRVDLLNAAVHGKDGRAVDELRMSQCAAFRYAPEQRGQGGEDCHGERAQENYQAPGNPLDTSIVIRVDNIATMNTIFGYETKHS